MALPSYEKLGVFYLGREIEREGSRPVRTCSTTRAT
jgi:hypothetical protein